MSCKLSLALVMSATNYQKLVCVCDDLKWNSNVNEWAVENARATMIQKRESDMRESDTRYGRTTDTRKSTERWND